MATGPMIGINLDNNSTIPVEIFHQGVLSPNPSNPDPLLAGRRSKFIQHFTEAMESGIIQCFCSKFRQISR
jgi:hypothetical protein